MSCEGKGIALISRLCHSLEIRLSELGTRLGKACLIERAVMHVRVGNLEDLESVD